MLIKFHGDLANSYKDFEFVCTNMKDVFSGIRLNYGNELVNVLLSGKYAFVVESSSLTTELKPEVILTDLKDFNIVNIIPVLEGNASMLAIMVIATVVLTAIAGVAIALTSSLDQQTSEDPNTNLKSNLFGNAPLLRNEGGVVPLIYGSPYCGGVLISSGIYTTTTNFPGMITG